MTAILGASRLEIIAPTPIICQNTPPQFNLKACDNFTTASHEHIPLKNKIARESLNDDKKFIFRLLSTVLIGPNAYLGIPLGTQFARQSHGRFHNSRPKHRQKPFILPTMARLKPPPSPHFMKPCLKRPRFRASMLVCCVFILLEM